MTRQGNPKTLKRVGKTKNLKPYETSNFSKDLESQNEIRNLDLTTKGRGNPPTFRLFVAKITFFININKKITMEIIAEIEKKTARGGARQGAGRKRKGVWYYGFRARQEVHDILQAVEGSKADFINDCILKATGREQSLSSVEGSDTHGRSNEFK